MLKNECFANFAKQEQGNSPNSLRVKNQREALVEQLKARSEAALTALDNDENYTALNRAYLRVQMSHMDEDIADSLNHLEEKRKLAYERIGVTYQPLKESDLLQLHLVDIVQRHYKFPVFNPADRFKLK